LKGIRLGAIIYITRILYVANMLLFRDGFLRDEKFIHQALNLYRGANRMEVNQLKSCILFLNIVLGQERVLLTILPLHVGDFQEGFKYIGFDLNPNEYIIKDWL